MLLSAADLNRADKLKDQQRHEDPGQTGGAEAQPFESRRDVLAGRAGEEEGVHARIERVPPRLHQFVCVEGELAVEAVVAHHQQHRNQQQREQGADSRHAAQRPRAPGEIALHQILRADQAQGGKEHRERGASQNRPGRVPGGEAAAHQMKEAPADGLVYGEGDERGGLPLGVDALGHALVDRNVKALGAVLLGDGLDLGPGGDILFVPHKGVGGFLGIDRGVEAEKRQAHEDQRQDKGDQHEHQGDAVLPFDLRQLHDSSSFRITPSMYTPAQTQRIRKPMTESAVAGPFLRS